MDIFETLRSDHTEIRTLLNEIIHQTSVSMPTMKRVQDKPQDWAKALYDLKLALIGHNRAEEAVVYSRLVDVQNGYSIIDEETYEHHIAEEVLRSLESLDPLDTEWSTNLGLLKNQIESHQAEEETQTFELLRPVIDAKASDQLAQEFESLRHDVIEGVKYHPKGRSIINPAGLNLES